MPARIEVRLPANRALPGWLRVLDEHGAALYCCECLGKADGLAAIKARNPTRDPLQPFGDTPLGQWRGRISAKPMADTRTYGIHPVIMLDPVGGDALRAQKEGKRSGMWLHGGALRIGSLRPTYGCIRVADDSMAAILEIFTPLVRQIGQWIPVDTVAA